MTGKSIVAIAGAVAAIATSCSTFFANYDLEFHLEPDRPNISRTWDADQPIPAEIYEELRKQ